MEAMEDLEQTFLAKKKEAAAREMDKIAKAVNGVEARPRRVRAGGGEKRKRDKKG